MFEVIYNSGLMDALFGSGEVQMAFWGALAKLAAPLVGGLFGGGAQNRDAELKARMDRDRLMGEREQEFQRALLARDENRRRSLNDAWNQSRRAELVGQGGLRRLMSAAGRSAYGAIPESQMAAADALRRGAEPLLAPGDPLEQRFGAVSRAPVTSDEQFAKLLKSEPWWKRLLNIGAGVAPQIAGSIGGRGRLGTTQYGDDV